MFDREAAWLEWRGDCESILAEEGETIRPAVWLFAKRAFRAGWKGLAVGLARDIMLEEKKEKTPETAIPLDTPEKPGKTPGPRSHGCPHSGG